MSIHRSKDWDQVNPKYEISPFSRCLFHKYFGHIAAPSPHFLKDQRQKPCSAPGLPFPF